MSNLSKLCNETIEAEWIHPYSNEKKLARAAKVMEKALAWYPQKGTGTDSLSVAGYALAEVEKILGSQDDEGDLG